VQQPQQLGMRRTNWLQSEYETLSGYQKQPEILGLSKGNICSAKALVGIDLITENINIIIK
jgi:hypothetical protein